MIGSIMMLPPSSELIMSDQEILPSNTMTEKDLYRSSSSQGKSKLLQLCQGGIIVCLN